MSSKREEAKCFLRRLYRCNSSLLEYKKGLEGLQEITTENQSDDLPLDHTEKVEKYQKALEQKIISIIEKVSDATLKTLLHCRYIDFLKWDDVAVKIGCYPESIKQLHNTALDAVGDILAAEKATENNTNEALVEKIQSGVDVKKNMGLLYEQNKNFIYKCALPYSHRIEIEDLMQEAYFGLVKAVNSFDSSKGAKFLTYAIYHIRNALCNYYYKCGRTKRMPAHLIVKLSAYHHFVYDYESKNGEPPSDEQIQSHLNLSNTQYKALKKALTESTCSLEDVVPGTDLTVYDGVADEFDIEDTVLNTIANDQVNAEIWESVNGLSPRLKNVIELRYKNGLTQSDVAKELGVSGSRIAQCEHQAYKLLKTDARMRYAAEYYGYNSSITYFGGKAFYKQHGSSTEYIALNHIEAETKLKQINEYFENIDWSV